MKKAIFITVRTSSSRLPQKCLLEINGRKSIEFLIQRLKRSKRADLLVLCTTTKPEDDILCEIARKADIQFFRGSEKDKLERWRGAAHKFNVDFFVTADGDDLFCEPELIDLAFNQYDRNKCDFIEGKDLAVGSFTYAIKVSALDKVCEIKNTDDTEMMWVYFTDTVFFRTEQLEKVPDIYKRPEIRMTLDYEQDLIFFKTVIEYFALKGDDEFTLKDIIQYLDRNSHVIKINQYLQNQFLENQKTKTKLILKRDYYETE
jgi:spore coat polysaccharide biosynthesis protein SpsF